MIKLIECPRDAMQGLPYFIETNQKANYINSLLSCGFDIIDFGSFVSPKAIPQMRDTAAVLSKLDLTRGNTELLAIVANLRGAEGACTFEEIKFLGFPLSLSETFQHLNTNSSIATSFSVLAEIQNLCLRFQKTLVVYLSMGFGNPYNDPYNLDIVSNFLHKLDALDVSVISLADTVGTAQNEIITKAYQLATRQYPHIEFGAHLHATRERNLDKIKAAYQAGCKRFDSAIKGYGGCPMAGDVLVGNIDTEILLDFLQTQDEETRIDKAEFQKALQLSGDIFL